MTDGPEVEGGDDSAPRSGLALPGRPTPETALAHVFVWHEAVRLQAARVLAGSDGPDLALTRQADAHLFALALRNLHLAAQLVRRCAARPSWSPIDKALNRFDEAVPDAKDLRDVISHFDAYAMGEGVLQSKRSEPAVTFYSRDAETYSLSIVLAPGADALTIDVGAATEAATELVVAVQSALP